MKKLSGRPLLVLKFFHILGIVCWMSGVICSSGLLLIVSQEDSYDNLLYLFDLLRFLDFCFIIPGAVLSLLIGLSYGFFTKWGFASTRWLVVKWIVFLIAISIGAFIFLPTIETMHHMALEYNAEVFASQVFRDKTIVALSLVELQGILMVFIVLISTLKPWGRRKSPKTARSSDATKEK